MTPLRLGVLGSGKGSNYGAIHAAIGRGTLAAEVRLVASDVADAGILALARAHGVPARHIPPGPFKTRLDPAAEEEYVAALHAAEVEVVALAGFMRVLKRPLIAAFPRRIVNIHPSLLPKFRGLAAWRQALAAGERETGCTVHFVDAGVDTGEIIAQRRVPILADDTPETLHARIQVAEHELYPQVLQNLAAGRRAAAVAGP